LLFESHLQLHLSAAVYPPSNRTQAARLDPFCGHAARITHPLSDVTCRIVSHCCPRKSTPNG